MTEPHTSSRVPEPTADFGSTPFDGTEVDHSSGFDDSTEAAPTGNTPEDGAHSLPPRSEGDIPQASVADLIRRQFEPEG